MDFAVQRRSRQYRSKRQKLSTNVSDQEQSIHRSNPRRKSAAAAKSNDDDPDWSKLPDDVLGEIVIRNHLVEEFIIFSAVCRSWRCAASTLKKDWHRKNRQMPWIITCEARCRAPDDPEVNFYNPNENKRFTISCLETNTLRVWGTFYGWIVVIDEHYNVYLYNPLTRNRLGFPNLRTLPNYVDVHDCTRIFVLKMPEYEYEGQFLVVALIGKYMSFAKPSSEAWILVEPRKDEITVADVAYWSGLLLIVYNNGSLAYCDHNIGTRQPVKTVDYLPCPHQLKTSLNPKLDNRQLYIAESDNGNLLLIYRKQKLTSGAGFVGYASRYDVYMLDPNTKEWKTTNSLGNNVALFIGETGTMSISCASEVENCKPNCIYFIDDQVYVFREGMPLEIECKMDFYDVEANTIQLFCKQIYDRFPQLSWFMPMM